MSLTRHLADPSSPIHKWFARRLPHTAPVVAEAHRTLRGTAVAPALAATATDPRLAGTTLDLLVRATLAPRGWSAGPTIGALQLLGKGIDGAPEVARAACERLQALAPAQLAATDDAWHEVAVLCVLLARFEQAGRSGHATEWSAVRLRSVATSLDAYIATELIDDADVGDTLAAAPAIADDHADLRAAKPLWLGPTFALSGALGGADADIIAGGVLLDFKAATTRRIVRGSGLWHLLT